MEKSNHLSFKTGLSNVVVVCTCSLLSCEGKRPFLVASCDPERTESCRPIERSHLAYFYQV